MADRCYDHKARSCTKCVNPTVLEEIDLYVEEQIDYLEDCVDMTEYDAGRLHTVRTIQEILQALR
jgi:hypothetical protein